MPQPDLRRALRNLAILCAWGFAGYAAAALVLGLIGCHEGWWTK